MQTIDLDPALHDRSLDLATAQVAAVRPADLTRPTPCAGWDLAALLAHMVGQNHGFATAIRGEAVDPAAFAPVAGAGLAEWIRSVENLRDARETPDPNAVLLPEISTTQRFPMSLVIAFHTLDSAVHAWDVAASLPHGPGRTWRPDPELAAVVLTSARQVPDGEQRTAPGAAFGPSLAVDDRADPWSEVLTQLGRRP
ncbi:TIGR03086 family metal-binding protein [Pseudonocardia ailaonensis]|uniref:TIGR03086 family metal-binding protein n=1 Tax=Pseudonocardia ailaonensis TaxID=367279 RepID=A0ABN2MP46_9PSEU